MVKINEDFPTVFGLDVIHKEHPVKIVEGPLDSLFLDNCLAAAGSAFNKIRDLNIENPIVIIDNEPRNEAICNILHKNIKDGHKVVIWPDSIVQKDINDMVLAGHDVQSVVESNVYSVGQVTSHLPFVGLNSVPVGQSAVTSHEPSMKEVPVPQVVSA